TISGLIPFRMGRSLSRLGLVDALEATGFEVLGSGYLMHTPRVLGLWLGECLARMGSERGSRALRGLFNSAESALRRLPTRAWTGHWVAAHGARRGRWNRDRFGVARRAATEAVRGIARGAERPPVPASRPPPISRVDRLRHPGRVRKRTAG